MSIEHDPMGAAEQLQPLPAALELDEAHVRFQALKQAAEQTRKEMRETLHALAAQVGTEQAIREALLPQIYWAFREELHTQWIAEAFGMTVYDLVQCVRTRMPDITCGRCKQPIIVTSRLHYKELQAGRAAALCERCHEVKAAQYRAEQEALRRQDEAMQRAALARLELLQTMPLQDYYRTPEWQSHRRESLRRAKYRCQVCNHRGELHVCHRTFERRGDEWPQDLVVLCRRCHELYYQQGKLPKD